MEPIKRKIIKIPETLTVSESTIQTLLFFCQYVCNKLVFVAQWSGSHLVKLVIGECQNQLYRVFFMILLLFDTAKCLSNAMKIVTWYSADAHHHLLDMPSIMMYIRNIPPLHCSCAIDGEPLTHNGLGFVQCIYYITVNDFLVFWRHS